MMSFVGIAEIASVAFMSVGLLLCWNANSPRAHEASLKYVLYSGLALVTLWTGVALLTAVPDGSLTGSQNLYGIVLFSAGLAVGVALAPFHMWLPDVVETCSARTASFICIGLKLVCVGALAFTFVLGREMPVQYLQPWHTSLGYVASISLLYGAVLTFRQTHIKRLLAYGSVSQGGAACVGLVTYFNAFDRAALVATAFHIIAYSTAILGLFAVVSYFENETKRPQDFALRVFSGLVYRNRLAGIASSLLILSCATVPLTPGFWSRLFLASSSLTHSISMAVILLLSSVIGSYAFLKTALLCWQRPGDRDGPIRLDFSHRVVLFLCFIMTIVGGAFPELLLTWMATPTLP